jgi:hypothetical protein
MSEKKGAPRRYAICIENEGNEASLVRPEYAFDRAKAKMNPYPARLRRAAGGAETLPESDGTSKSRRSRKGMKLSRAQASEPDR